MCQDCLKLTQWFWRKGFFNFVNVFSLFRNYLPLGKGGALHLNKPKSPSPKDALCQVGLKLAKWFWRRRFLNFVNVFSLFGNYLSLEKGGALYLNNLESPSPEDALFQVWLKLAKWFWRRRFFNFVNVFSLIRYNWRRQRQTTDKNYLSLRFKWAKNQTLDWNYLYTRSYIPFGTFNVKSVFSNFSL